MYGWMSAVIWKTADGTKLRTAHKKQKVKNRLGGGIINWSPDTTEYIGDLILKNSHPVMLLYDGGYASFSHDTIDGLHYYIQDYQGNNRMVLSSNGTIEQVTHYYPYGGVIGDISTNENVQKYKFEGKELDRTFGLDNYDIHARQYFAMAPMWDRIDPMAEKYYGISPYVYCWGDPVNLGDYDGEKVKFSNYGGKAEYLEKEFQRARDYLRNIGFIDNLLEKMVNDPNYTVIIQFPSNSKSAQNGNNEYDNRKERTGQGGYNEGILWWDPTNGVKTDNDYIMSPVEGLYHEASHAVDDLKDGEKSHKSHKKRAEKDPSGSNPYDSAEEERAITTDEQELARAMGKLKSGQVTRNNHRGTRVTIDTRDANGGIASSTLAKIQKRKL